ncbi:MAG: beta strand repeat-containing protein, partial [Acutalibacteraceae bacterium]
MNKRKWLSILLCIVLALSMLPVATSAAEDKGNISLSAVTGNPSGSSNEGYANLFDGNTGSKWCCSFSGSAYVIFKASEPVKVSGYSIATANDTAGYSERNPVEWTLSACTNYEDESTSWTVIDTVTDGRLPSANETYTDFILSEPTPLYQYFKLEITKINSGSLMQISEIAMVQCDHQFEDTGTTIAPTCTEGGYDVYECSICHLQKNVLNDEPANGHNFENGIGICTVCGYWPVDHPVNYLDENGTEQTVVCDASITAEYLSNNSNTLTSGWYLVNSDVTIFDRITVSGTVHLILADGYTLTAKQGIQVQDTNALTIYGQASGTGTLTATGGYGGAGIGGGGSMQGNGGSGGSVTINGGTVIATGGMYAAGIGGGAGGIDVGRYTGGSGANVTINGGTVIATSTKTFMNTYAPGIGGGIGNTTGGAGGSLTVTGGYVVANGIGGAGSKNGNSPGANGTFSVSGNSVVISDYIKDSADTSGWSGIVFIGDSGTVYGTSVTPEEDFEIPGGKTLTIANGQTLTIPAGVTLTNNGTIIIEDGGTLVNNGTIINNGTITNNGTYTGNAPKCSATYLDADGTEKTALCDAILTADNIGSYTTINEGWYIVRGNVTTSSRITISGDVHLILADNCNLNANSGIDVTADNRLTVYAQSTEESTMGTLTAKTTDMYGAAIGGGNNASGGNITVNGGIVNATATAKGGGFTYGAAIGGNITISGGTVNANVTADGGYAFGAAIGGGNISVNGGIVNATVTAQSGGAAYGAAIGGGITGSGGNIIISGGTVNANVTADGGYAYCAAIGGDAGGTFSTGENGNAVIFASSISDQSGKTAGTWSGVIFEGNDGKVYGTSIAPTEDFEMGSS